MSMAELLRAVPFAHGANLSIVHSEPGHAVVRIPHEPGNLNHVGTLHAAALVLVAETAGGIALLAHPALMPYLLLAKGLAVRYRRPAPASCNAHARVADDEVSAVVATVESVGKADFPVRVEVKSDEGELLAELTIDYHLRKRA